jgi:hypothetical protein
MATFSKKVMGKEVGQASTYAEPHTMSGKKFNADAKSIQVKKDPNTLNAREVGPRSVAMRVSVGDPGNSYVKTDGIEMRGAGAATKGRMSRGPMG